MRTMGNMKKSITADSDFAAWAAARSQKTNRSLAGARLAIPGPQKHAEIKSQAQQWGMTVEDATMTDEHNEEFLCDGTQSIDSITDMRKASGLEAMEYAEQHMPVLRDTMDSLTTRVDFSGIRIAVCLILEPKTAILLRKLKAAGAIVGVYCGPDSTDPRVAEQLRREGITVESSRDWTAEQAHEAALHLLDEIQPDIIIDEVSKFYNIDADALRGQGRTKDTALARQIAMYQIRRMTNLSLKEIGKEFEGRDHTTVMHSIDRIEKLTKTNPEIAEVIKDINANINARYE